MMQWLDQRTGLSRAVREFLVEPIPASIGWRRTLGSVAGALLLVQIVSGLLLAVYYVPHPDAAYKSVEYVENSVTAGKLVRALHYWGASFAVVAVFVHLVRVFLSGAYRPPREATWIVGVILLLLVLALAFTGQLLPWNQVGYWSASVGIEIAASTPVVGAAVKQLLVGGSSPGALTLTRFYALHAILLPGLMVVLILAHLYLLRHHGPARPARDQGSEVAPFAPAQLSRDLVVISVVLGLLVALALIVGLPAIGPADPTDTAYLPRPEWYFQAHYQLLRLTPGPLKLLTTFVLPALGVAALFGLPWLDRGRSSRASDRLGLVSVGSLTIAVIVALTLVGTLERPPVEARAADTAGTYDPIEAGRRIYEAGDCKKCHTVGLEGGNEGPDLSNVGLRLQEPYMRKFLRAPEAYVPDIKMPAVKVPEREFNELVEYLKSLREEPGR
ncbi:MAG: cytochrome b N-terminal domain-containing protein [Acidobacteria bacterium]|nr:cytochrome b N-terminal domain-containing protein [Acidobacteriota bacterium]